MCYKEEAIERRLTVESPAVRDFVPSGNWGVISEENTTLPEFVTYGPRHVVLKTQAVARDIHYQDYWTTRSLIYRDFGDDALLED
jgi:hypothetical protein